LGDSIFLSFESPVAPKTVGAPNPCLTYFYLLSGECMGEFDAGSKGSKLILILCL